MTPAEIIKAVEAGVKIIVTVAELIAKAKQGSKDAAARLRRVEDILSETSPTEAEFERATDIADGKPSRSDEQ